MGQRSHKTIYVANDQVWAAAQATAEARGISLSAYVTEALDAYQAVSSGDPKVDAQRLVRQLSGVIEKLDAPKPRRSRKPAA